MVRSSPQDDDICDKCGGKGGFLSATHTPLNDNFWIEVRFTKYKVHETLGFCQDCWEDLWNQAVEARRCHPST